MNVGKELGIEPMVIRGEELNQRGFGGKYTSTSGVTKWVVNMKTCCQSTIQSSHLNLGAIILVPNGWIYF